MTSNDRNYARYVPDLALNITQPLRFHVSFLNYMKTYYDFYSTLKLDGGKHYQMSSDYCFSQQQNLMFHLHRFHLARCKLWL